ncbi:MAG: hypothetical protein HPM95_16995 [Alphaproteobacteria bacterium]|nr:hypothetical protein [Alphaproteobacteria bacterium]
MSNRSNHPVSDTDHRGDRRADDGHGGFEEDPLVELARIVSEGNAKFRPVAMAEPLSTSRRRRLPTIPMLSMRPAGTGRAGAWRLGRDVRAVPCRSPVAPAHGEADYSDAYARRSDLEDAPSPAIDAAGSHDVYADTWQGEPTADDWADDARFAEAPRAPGRLAGRPGQSVRRCRQGLRPRPYAFEDAASVTTRTPIPLSLPSISRRTTRTAAKARTTARKTPMLLKMNAHARSRPI